MSGQKDRENVPPDEEMPDDDCEHIKGWQIFMYIKTCFETYLHFLFTHSSVHFEKKFGPKIVQ